MDGDQHITLTITIQSLNPSDLSIYDAHQIATDVQQMIMNDMELLKLWFIPSLYSVLIYLLKSITIKFRFNLK